MSDTAATTGIGTLTITQVGLVVRDIEKTARAFADVFGVPVPPVNLTDGGGSKLTPSIRASPAKRAPS